jgi:hypothetical protein
MPQTSAPSGHRRVLSALFLNDGALPSRRSHAAGEQPLVESATERARQSPRHNVRYVLVINACGDRAINGRLFLMRGR